MQDKCCRHCQEIKPINNFYFNKSRGYYLSDCNICRKLKQRKYNKQYWDDHKEHLKKVDWRQEVNTKWNNKLPGGVYMIKNLQTGQCYIGQSNKPNKRRGSHFGLHKGKNGEFSLPTLYNDMLEYGKDSFVFGVIEFEEDKNKRLQLEKKYINLHKPYYNND